MKQIIVLTEKDRLVALIADYLQNQAGSEELEGLTDLAYAREIAMDIMNIVIESSPSDDETNAIDTALYWALPRFETEKIGNDR